MPGIDKVSPGEKSDELTRTGLRTVEQLQHGALSASHGLPLIRNEGWPMSFFCASLRTEKDRKTVDRAGRIQGSSSARVASPAC